VLDHRICTIPMLWAECTMRIFFYVTLLFLPFLLEKNASAQNLCACSTAQIMESSISRTLYVSGGYINELLDTGASTIGNGSAPIYGWSLKSRSSCSGYVLSVRKNKITGKLRITAPWQILHLERTRRNFLNLYTVNDDGNVIRYKSRRVKNRIKWSASSVGTVTSGCPEAGATVGC
jgi:hypothetical protein